MCRCVNVCINRCKSLWIKASAKCTNCNCNWSAHAGTHKQLSDLAQKYLAVAATSVPCARLFSLAGNMVQKKGAGLSTEDVEKLVSLSNWLREN